MMGARPSREPGWALYSEPYRVLAEGTAEDCLEWMLKQPVPYRLRQVEVSS
jgi:hypothetical protein